MVAKKRNETRGRELELIHTTLGVVTIFQYGAGPNGVMRTLGKYMIGSGATFGYEKAILFGLYCSRVAPVY